MICFVCGQICSGKSLYSQTLTKISDCFYLEVGDIVRSIKGSTDRKVLQDTKELAAKIIEFLDLTQRVHAPKQLVVSGVRQKEILEFFPESILIWIECPKDERKRRYLLRSKPGDDTQTFDEADRGDIALGILDVKKYILNKQ